MRGPDEQTNDMFSYLSPEERVRPDHPLRAIRRIMDQVLWELSPHFTRIYSDIGRPSIPPEQLLRSQRAAADGRDRLQRAVSLVRGHEHG